MPVSHDGDFDDDSCWDFYDHCDADDVSDLACIDAEPVQHVGQLASLLLKLMCLQ